MIRMPLESLGLLFGGKVPRPHRPAEWEGLGIFLALGVAAFVVAFVLSAFVPLAWPDTIRHSRHSVIFVPVILLITTRMVRHDALTVPASESFNPWPVARSTPKWLMFGAALSVIVALIFFVLFALRWSPNALFRPFSFGVMTLWSIPLIAAAEEYAFRGYAFWRLIRLFGFWPAQLVVAALFAVSHMTLGGFALLPALVGTVTGSALYGVAFARARGIAAPIALHTGWNIAQHLLLSPLDPTATPFAPRVPHVPGTAEYAGMLSVVAIVMVVGMFVLLRSPDRTESSSSAL